MKPYDKSIVDFIENNRMKYTTEQIVLKIKEKYNKDITTKAIRKYYYRHNLEFKRHYNRKDKCVFAKKIGEESAPDKNGLIRIKINDKQWQYKQRYLYEKYHNVKLPENYLVIFIDGDKSNFKKNNLLALPKDIIKTYYCLTKGEFKEKDLVKTGLLIAELKNKIGGYNEKIY